MRLRACACVCVRACRGLESCPLFEMITLRHSKILVTPARLPHHITFYFDDFRHETQDEHENKDGFIMPGGVRRCPPFQMLLLFPHRGRSFWCWIFPHLVRHPETLDVAMQLILEECYFALDATIELGAIVGTAVLVILFRRHRYERKRSLFVCFR